LTLASTWPKSAANSWRDLSNTWNLNRIHDALKKMESYTMSNLQPLTSQPSTSPWPDSNMFWRDKRVTVTGGAGFLGSFVVDKLRERGAADITFASLSTGFVPRKREYDLVQPAAVLALLEEWRCFYVQSH